MESVFPSKPRGRGFLAAGCMVLACLGLLLMSSDTAATTPRGLQILDRRLQILQSQICNLQSPYYVSPDGDDDNPGTEARPWRTIQKATETLVAGDTVYIRAGTYHERVIPQNSGSAGQYITYAVYPGETAIIDGTGVVVPEYGGLFDLTGRDYIRVSRLRVIHSSYYGIVADNSSHITIEYNYTYDTYSSGISSWGSNHVIVDGNEVVGACTDPWQEHISISNTDTFEVRYNHIHDVMPGTYGKEGLSVKDASSHGKVYGNHVYNLNHVGIYVDAEAEHLFDVEVYQNLVHDIEAMGFALASEQGGLLENVRLYNNIAYNNLVGLWLSACCIATHPFQDITVINNTFAYNGRNGWGGGIGIENTQVQNVVIRNNICSQNTYSQMAADPSVLPELTADHNLTDGDRDPEFEFYGVGDLVEVSPSFVNPGGGDFHLQGSSPAIDHGSPADAPGDDFEGHARPYGAGVDIGADEFTLFGDLDYDCDVDIADIMLAANCWRSADPACAPYDLDHDSDIDIVDVMLVAVHWGERCETGDDKWALWTGGTQLRGANIWQRRVYPELDGPTFLGPGPVGPPYTQADFDNLAALGANYVNVSHPGLFTEEPPFVLDQDIQDNLDNLLAMLALSKAEGIEQAGLFAVISARTGPGRSDFTFYWDGAGDWFDESYLNDSMWQDQDAQDAWVAMWAYTAQRYKDNPIVVGYDLMVEPNSNEVGSHALYDRLDIWDPEEFYATYGGTLYDWNQLYPRITAAIRQVDADTPILIGGNGYSSLDWLPYVEPTGDPRTVYTVHQYEPHKYTHQDAGVQDCTYPGICDVDWDDEPEPFDWAWLEGRLTIIDTYKSTHGIPVAVNEFGAVRWTPNVDVFMDDEMDLFEQRGMNHALWVWDPAWEPWTQQVDAFNFRHGPDPNNHTDVASSDLIDVIVEHWGLNSIEPAANDR